MVPTTTNKTNKNEGLIILYLLRRVSRGALSLDWPAPGMAAARGGTLKGDDSEDEVEFMGVARFRKRRGPPPDDPPPEPDPGDEEPVGEDDDTEGCVSFAQLGQRIAGTGDAGKQKKQKVNPAAWIADIDKGKKGRRVRDTDDQIEEERKFKDKKAMDILLARGGLMSESREGEEAGVRRGKLSREKKAFAEELRACVIFAFKAFLGLILAAVQAGELLVIAEISFKIYDDTPMRCQVYADQKQDGRNVAHVLQLWLAFQLIWRFADCGSAIIVEGNLPTWLVPMASTGAEHLYEAIQRICVEFHEIVAKFIAQVEVAQNRKVWQGEVSCHDNAGSNGRYIRKDQSERRTRHHITFKCGMHAFHKILLGVLTLFPAIVGKMCKAAHSLQLDGVISRLRMFATEYFKKNSDLKHGSGSCTPEEKLHRTRYFDMAYGRKDDPHIPLKERERRLIAECFFTGEIKGTRPQIFMQRMLEKGDEQFTAFIKDRLSPSIITGRFGTWNVSRWTRNAALIRALLRMDIGEMFRFCYGPAVKATKPVEQVEKVKAKMLKDQKQRKSQASTSSEQADGEAGILAVFDPEALGLPDPNTTAYMQLAQAQRADSTLKFFCQPFSAGGQGRAKLTQLSCLTDEFDTQVHELIERSGNRWALKQLVAENEPDCGSADREYWCIRAARGLDILPLLVALASLMQGCWASGTYEPYTEEVGKTVPASNSIFKSIFRMNGVARIKVVNILGTMQRVITDRMIQVVKCA